MMRFVSALAVSAVLLTGCSSAFFADPEDALEQPPAETYRLDSGDRVRVSVFGQPELSGEFSVDSSGAVAMPLVQPIPARGDTTEDLARRIESVLAEKLLRNPAVAVEVSIYRPFFILGEVNRPGQYPYVNGMTVKTAAAIAGGFTYRATTGQVIITRRTGEETLEGTAAMNASVLPGDTVMVGERIF
jgi:polysaccharide export outer membrane protein